MYVPSRFQMTDTKEVVGFIRSNPFGILVASKNNIPIASHIPFWLEQKGDDYFLSGHLAVANELVKALETGPDVLAIFQGPHAYISPSWYEQPNVPTWNYQAVHVYGEAGLMSEQDAEEHVKILMEAYESAMPSGRKYTDMTEDYRHMELRGIRGFRLRIDNVEASYKLSQNRNDKDYKNIISELEASGDQLNRQVASEMKRRRRLGD